MAVYDMFVPGFEGATDVNVANIGAGGVSAAPIVGVLFQGITGSSTADALAQLSLAFTPPDTSNVHIYLQSNDGTI